MAKSTLAELKNALRARRFIRFSSRCEESPTRGYVLDVGPRFFLVALVSDRFWFDGFECFRYVDVSGVVADPYTQFAEAALRKRGERLPKKPRVSLASTEELLVTAGRAFPLVTISRELIDPDVCSIGKITEVGRDHVSLLEISPGAKWDEQPSRYRLSEITRVNFGGDYETALHLVGGVPAVAIRAGRNAIER